MKNLSFLLAFILFIGSMNSASAFNDTLNSDKTNFDKFFENQIFLDYKSCLGSNLDLDLKDSELIIEENFSYRVFNVYDKSTSEIIENLYVFELRDRVISYTSRKYYSNTGEQLIGYKSLQGETIFNTDLRGEILDNTRMASCYSDCLAQQLPNCSTTSCVIFVHGYCAGLCAAIVILD